MSRWRKIHEIYALIFKKQQQLIDEKLELYLNCSKQWQGLSLRVFPLVLSRIIPFLHRIPEVRVSM